MNIAEELKKLDKETLVRLTQKSDWLGWKALFINYALIIFSFSLVAFFPNVFSVIIALIILGGRQLGLAILMHDCAHGALFKTAWLNQSLGQWLCAAPILADIDGYRTYHLKHHHTAGTGEDPDRSNYVRYPVSKMSLVRKIIRDILGVTGIKTLIVVWKMNAGEISYQLSYDQVPLEGEEKGVVVGMKNLFPSIVINLSLLIFFVLIGKPLLFLLWPMAWLTTYMLFSRLRNAAEHAATPDIDDLDPRAHTRTTYANWFERLTLAPNYVNFHLEHHILASVPGYHLKEFHQELKSKGILADADIQPSYWGVVKKLVGAH